MTARGVFAAAIRSAVDAVRTLARRAVYFGNRRLCPICGATYRRFGRFGTVPRSDARCLRCGSLERHRLVWVYLRERTDLFDGRPKRFLHVAPEQCLRPRFERHFGRSYVSADRGSRMSRVTADVTGLPFSDAAFDVVYCSHVLEHVPNDRLAMRELCRVLRDDGWAILLVPITAATTFEDPTVTDPRERLRLFGEEDHVRRYGPDYVDRLREAGFDVAMTRASDLVDEAAAVRLGLTAAAGEIYFCTRLRRARS